jgi:hypothetical protein
VNRHEADLAAFVDGLGQRLDAVDTHLVRVDARLAQVDQMSADVAAVGRGLAELTAQVRALNESRHTVTAGPSPATVAGDTDGDPGDGAEPDGVDGLLQPDWLTVTDPDLAGQWLADAAEFATAILAHFPGTPLPACWPLHPAAVVDLIALNFQRAEAYGGESAAGVSEFAARWLPGAVRRLSAVTASCANRFGHIEDKRVYQVPALDPFRVALWWIDSRSTGLPTPSEAFALTRVGER